ncbi:hypothetical protein D4764_01G0015880 [Takifugu flavidus]|uniref:Uncharacterized protein n=1 Tax=Takifugu flavidus TaxID=433684 RepID=A0A5C6PQK9_9TELE|nr:hypothetical protein D4764_01G0015880 [Takifugu flavidus]
MAIYISRKNKIEDKREDKRGGQVEERRGEERRGEERRGEREERRGEET